ncbi:MAG TPA: FecR domain-containing protein [Polyangiaceae bacterium]
MNELERLGRALRRELGAPPEAWAEAQRARVMERVARTPRRRKVGLTVLLAAAVALAPVVVWTALRKPAPEPTERALVAAEMREPFRFEDGSTLALDPGARGRLVADGAFVRFELQGGRARFDVTPRQGRTWLVTAGKNEVRVVGTRFSVSYGPPAAFEVEVERGIVAVRVPERRTDIELGAGDHLRASSGRLEVGRSAGKAFVEGAAEGRQAGGATRDGAEPELRATDTEPLLETAAGPESPAEWRAFYREGKYAESLALLRARGLDHRLNELDARTLAEMADAARLGGDPSLAVRALTVLMQRFPRAPEARDGRFLLGRVQALRGDRAAAIAAFEAYLRPGGSTQYASEAVGRLMELYAARGDESRAREMARRYLQAAPNGPYRRLASSLVRPEK